MTEELFWELDSPSAKPAFEGACVGRWQYSVIGECKKDDDLMCKDIGGVYDVRHRRKVTSLGLSSVCRDVT